MQGPFCALASRSGSRRYGDVTRCAPQVEPVQTVWPVPRIAWIPPLN